MTYKLSNKFILILLMAMIALHIGLIITTFTSNKEELAKKEETRIIVTQAKITPKKIAKPKPKVVKKKKPMQKKVEKSVIDPPKIEEKEPDTVVVQEEVFDTTQVEEVVEEVAEIGISEEEINNIKNSYLAGLKTQLERTKKYPKMAKRMKQQGTVIVKFRISKLGELQQIGISRESKFSLLNKEASKTVARLGS